MSHPALYSSKPGSQATAAARAAEADEAAKVADQARLTAVTAAREAARAMMPLRIAENLKLRAEAELASAETALASATTTEARERADDARVKAIGRIAALQAQWAAAKAELQPKLDAVAPARAAAVAAEATRAQAAQAARDTGPEFEPVSVFISRRTQRLYVRRAFQPVLESPVTIVDSDRRIGTHIFTAMERVGGDSDLRWSVVSLDEGSPYDGMVEPASRARGGHDHNKPLASTGPIGARTALDRIVIPQDTLDRIVGMASPRSSLIISDEGLSSETGNGTDFIVILSGEPQGSIKIRRRRHESGTRY